MNDTFNPILRREEYTNGKRRLGSERPRPNASTALVFVKNGRIEETIREGEAVKWGIFVWQGYDAMYEIDLAPRRLNFIITDLPSKNSDTKRFEAEVIYSCKVENPGIIVKDKTTDVKEALFPKLTELLRRISPEYSIEDRRQAEIDIRRELEDTGVKIAGSKGFLIEEITVKLTLSYEAQMYLAELERSKDSVKHNEARHTVDLQTTTFRGELEILKTQQEISLQKIRQMNEMEIMQQKVQFYELMMKQGSLDALRLAQDPTAAEKIRHEQIEGDIIGMKFKLEGFVSMAETGAIAAPELAEHAKKLLSSGLFNNPSVAPNLQIAEEKAENVSDDKNASGSSMTPDDTIEVDNITNPE